MEIKNIFRSLAVAAAIVAPLASCSSDDDNNDDNKNSVNDTELSQAVTRYVNEVVYPTYRNLATYTGSLYTELRAAAEAYDKNPASLTQAQMDQICNDFLAARSEYEKSEAVLFGAATDFGIDPHIDTWPLDLQGLADALSNKTQLDVLCSDDPDDAIAYAAGKMGQDLLGFHGIEFIIFRDGKNRDVNTLAQPESYTEAVDAEGNPVADPFSGKNVTGREELYFAAAVAGDLRDRCWQLEVTWNADAPKAHADRVEEIEQPTTMRNGSTYGADMLNATKAGSSYQTWVEAVRTIIESGCDNIANEVANVKMGNPLGNGDEPDRSYIESPYSQNSFNDFRDNIISVRNSLYGSLGGSVNAGSIMSYLQKNDANEAATLKANIDAAIAALEACPSRAAGGFVKNINDPKVKEAQKAVQTLSEELGRIHEWFGKL